ncbi:MAG: transcription antitermination factor NusB [Clostridia bacterium]|nr:transcription antitermination factor NusB [Clostridia bacterium]
MSRKNAREDTFRIIFESLINKMEPEEYLLRYFEEVKKPVIEEEKAFLNEPTGKDNEYVKKVVDGVLGKQEELDGIIKENLKDWDVSRISKVSLAALRLALFEIMYMDDIPTGVAANEAVELAKRYEGQECASFVNGALGSAIEKLGK